MLLTVVIKTLNEQCTIARAIESSLAVVGGIGGEVIVVDSLSSDSTVQIAQQYPVTILQLDDPDDRSCGIGGELGFRHSSGRYIYILDGDMELQVEFVREGIKFLERHPDCGAVGGNVVELNLVGIEYILRNARRAETRVLALPGGGLYRRDAIVQLQYFTNPNLHAFEELELGIRLRAVGWTIAKLPLTSAFHKAYTMGPYQLLVRKWKGKYFQGSGELLRSSVGKDYFRDVLHGTNVFAINLAMAAWLLLTLGLSVLAARHGLSYGLLSLAAMTIFPFLAMTWRKRSLNLGIYSVVTWILAFLGFIRGFTRPYYSPIRPLPHSTLRGHIPSNQQVL